MDQGIKKLFVKKSGDRIWELDAFRGLCIIGVIFVHTVFDLRMLFGIWPNVPVWFDVLQEYGGLLFLILSGICVTLGHHNLIRGMIVAGGALIVSLVTYFMGDPEMYIFFGVLHLLAFCMLTYSLYRRLPWPVILVLGIGFIVLGYYFETLQVSSHYLFPLGLMYPGFAAGDYFPIFPYIGYFMLGVVLGRTLYRKKKTLFPKADPHFFLIRFLSFCGRHSLLIYLAHQPLVYGGCLLALTLMR